jgi:hypothetical protein
MATQKLIAIKEFCVHHQIPADLILQMEQFEMVELVWIKRTGYIPAKSLSGLEQILRIYQDLQINLEGIQAVLHLLDKLEEKEAALQKLRDQLMFYSRS